MTNTNKFGIAITDSLEEARDLALKLETAKVEGVRIEEIVKRDSEDFGRYMVTWMM